MTEPNSCFFETLPSSEKWDDYHSEPWVFRWLAEPDHDFLGSTINFTHKGNLENSPVDVILVDANGIDPKVPDVIGVSKWPQSLAKIGANIDGAIGKYDFIHTVKISPNTRESLKFRVGVPKSFLKKMSSQEIGLLPWPENENSDAIGVLQRICLSIIDIALTAAL
jgi:hypothetical protein